MGSIAYRVSAGTGAGHGFEGQGLSEDDVGRPETREGNTGDGRDEDVPLISLRAHHRADVTR